MASYRVFELRDAPAGAKALGDDIRFVRDGFSFWALVFPAIWLLWHRLWLGFAALVFYEALLLLLADWVGPLPGLVLGLLAAFYIALEGTNLRAMKLAANGFSETDLVVAGNEEEAEMRFFSRRNIKKQHPLAHEAPGEPSLSPLKARPVIGVFPARPFGLRS